MFIQGDLQAVFDALYSIGVIDPVLKMDWGKIAAEATQNQNELSAAIDAINGCAGDRALLTKQLAEFRPATVNFIAVEVAREFAEFTSRAQLH